MVIDHNAGVYIRKEDYGSGINVIGVGNIYDNDILDGETYRLGPVNDDKFLLEENDLIYGESSLVPGGIARTVCVGKNGTGSAFAWHTRRVKLDQNIVNSHFATLELNYNVSIQKHLMSASIQTALTGMTAKGYFGTTSVLPSVKGQAVINEFLKSPGHPITLHQCRGSAFSEWKDSGFLQKHKIAWEQCKVSDMSKIIRCNVLPVTMIAESQSDEKPYLAYSSQTKEQGLMGHYKEYLFEDVITWTIDGANTGTVNYRPGKFYCTNVCGVLLSDNNKANQMASEASNRVSESYVPHVGNPKLMNNVMADIKIKVPCSSIEQEKIGKYPEQLDHLIILHQCKESASSEWKDSGFLQKHETAWEQRKAKELCSISTGKSNTQDRIEDGKYPFYVRSPIVERSNRYLSDEEAVSTVGDGVGIDKVLHYVNGKYDLHQRAYGMFGFSEETPAKYFYYYFSNHFYDRVMAMTAKTFVDSVRYEMIVDMEISSPNRQEQACISMLLEQLDSLITLHQQRLKLLKRVKRAMVSCFFTEKYTEKNRKEPENMIFKYKSDFEGVPIKTLSNKGWGKEVIKYPTEKDLLENWVKILFDSSRGIDRLNNHPLIDGEMQQILE